MTCLFRELTVKANCFCSTMNPRGSFIFFLCICRHCRKVTNFVSFLARYQYGESRAGEGRANLVRPGIQSEHRIHLILPARAVSYMIKWLIISNPISRSQVSTCCFFPCKSQTELLSYSIQHMMVSWWSNETLIFFSFNPLRRVHQFPNRNIGKTYIPQSISSFHFVFCLHLFSPPWGEKINR